jgi:hypothetical protein
MHLKPLEKLEQIKPRNSRQKEIKRISVDINEMETKNQYKESMKQKVGSLKG